MRVCLLAGVSALALSGASLAQDHDHHADHEHGAGRLDVTVAGAQLRADLTLTGSDLFGEDTADDQRTLAAARRMFGESERFLTTPDAAGCELAVMDVVEAVVEEDGEHEGHRDFTAYYTFACDHADELSAITVTAFAGRDELAEIEAAAAVDGRVAEAELTPDAPVFDLTATEAAPRRQLGAHEHGASTLNIAVEGDTIQMELESPAMDVVGFEFAPTTDEQKAAIEQGRTLLGDPLGLFVVPAAAGCAVAEASVEHVFEDAERGHADEAEGGTHSEFQARYAMTCTDVSAVTAIDFRFFEVFPNAEEVEVQIITEQGQTGAEVERDDPRLELGNVI